MPVRIFWRHAVLVAGGVLTLSGCSPREHDAVVASVANEPITVSEYEHQYLKNSPNRDSAAAMPLEARQRFLDLIVNYKLKLADAKRQNLEQQPAVRNEIRQYKGGLAATYITDREIVSPALRRLYERRKAEIRASHILIDLSPNASPSESVAAYTSASRIVDSLKKGESFEALAKRNSKDPSAQQNGGDLYYFVAGTMVSQFEDSVFAMKTGQVSIIRSPYGLHVVRLTDLRPSSGELRASHIMVRFRNMAPTPQDTAEALARITAIKDSLARGADFEGLARRNSADPGSAPQGGDLGWFSRRRWVQPFDEAVFAMQPGQTSGIVRTPYGYHLIKCTDHRPLKSFEESKQELQKVYQQGRYPSDLSDYMARLKQSLGFRRDNSVIDRFLARSDSNRNTRDSAWAAGMTPELAGKPVFSARGQHMTLDSLVSAINQKSDFPQTLLRKETFETSLGTIEEQFVWTVAADSFGTVYPEFASVLNEYRDGVLLYELEQENIWNKVSPADSVLRGYYARNRDRFTWPERLELTELRIATEPLAARVANLLKAGKSMDELAVEDSIRMAQPVQFSILFKQNSASLTSNMMKTLAAAASQVRREPLGLVQLLARQDTGKSAAALIGSRRLQAVKKYLTVNLNVDSSRIKTAGRRPAITASGPESDSLAAVHSRQVDISIVGRQALILAKPETSLLAASSDERAAHADSLAPGGVSAPFLSRGLYYIVRLNKREPPRIKTFEEAQIEVSSVYQETESKRLEDQWLKSLHARYPVVVNTETLRAAFAPVKQ